MSARGVEADMIILPKISITQTTRCAEALSAASNSLADHLWTSLQVPKPQTATLGHKTFSSAPPAPMLGWLRWQLRSAQLFWSVSGPSWATSQLGSHQREAGLPAPAWLHSASQGTKPDQARAGLKHGWLNSRQHQVCSTGCLLNLCCSSYKASCVLCVSREFSMYTQVSFYMQRNISGF